MKWNPLKKYNSWTIGRVLRHVLYWGLWSAFFINLNYLVKEWTPYASWLQFEFAVLPVKIICAYTIAYFIMPKFLYRKKYLSFIFLTSGALLFFGYLLFLIYKFWVHPLMGYDADIFFNLEFFYKALELVYITSLVVCIKFFQNHLHQEKINNRLREEKTSAELKYLKNQIQPHFLFNTLNNLYGLVLSNDERAPDTIVKLSDMLAYMLYESATDTVLLSQEIDNLKNYIALEKMRYDRKLDLLIEIGEIPDGMEIAPILLIPFVENAFKHGPAKEEGQSEIRIHAGIEQGVFKFVVENTFSSQQMDDKIKSGIGLNNVKKRLELIYPDQHELIVEEGRTFCVRLKLKLGEEVYA